MALGQIGRDELVLNLGATLGGKLLLAEPPEAMFVWETDDKGNRHPTDKVEAYAFAVSCLERGFKFASVRIEDPHINPDAFEPGKAVSFEGLTGELGGGYKDKPLRLFLSATAAKQA